MSIKYKTIQKAQPGVAGGGDKKFYASPVYQGEKTLEGLTKDIEKISTVSGADIRAVLYALVDVMQTSLSEGRIVRLGELGSMRVSLSSEGKAKEEEVTSVAIKSAKVLFTPGSDLKKMLQTLKFEKA
ncbi:HU family DNA-binding protein [Riemerella anatipestifer]|uniref:HU family DNA-binding protein n=1 Tax=Riemerella anatipestifer TaxID=34085 RepID=A0AAP6HEX3_RIEAN|nr:HU family DNA-binding protein [Riemerella anatipestifer]MCD5968510.1 HU family DNA-binding protein [Riemerella anatipestifer]MCU7539452.1 HU family DNA-binding protein [Riemerella anatipestifer]MCU7569521.1 HU family DNA-binding protein [Riemerella anatipestifer]MCU7596782.1 HU family DNA-binding protein [Riemerella anatipestifer]MCW0494050.1 HU family DNA-binding protein [Riemerella anatipestifer]